MKARFEAATVPAIVAVVLTSVYVATLAPGVTLWDSGEFLAAIHSLGIPHPPGTPLYVVVAAVWGQLFAPLFGFAYAVNLLSAMATAAGCAVLGVCVARWMSSRTGGIAAGLAAGGMLSVWRSATETEVYALSFALAFVTLWLADRAGRSGRPRDAALALYVLALALPLHLSALVVAPGVVYLAATNAAGVLDWRRAITLGAGAVLAMALGTTHIPLAVVSVLVLLGAGLTRRDVVGWRWREHVGLIGVVVLAAAALGVMYFRAQFDPFVNQGNPATIDALVGVVGREQYDVPPLWPRRAPLWLQLGNLVQYADWQVAFGLDNWVGPTITRTPFTALFAALAIAGALWHRTHDRRSFRGFAIALASASLGSVLVLNLRAGPSIGIGVLPSDALHEARERDYFFAMAFAMAAAWAGLGATRLGLWLAARLRTRALVLGAALILGSLPLLLNWRAADRSSVDDITLAQRIGTGLLDSAPPNAVLFVAGDNDTYPLWYLQRVEQIRADVTVITIPLLPATWYRQELERRHGIISGPSVRSWRGMEPTLAVVAQHAMRQGRPIAVSLSVAARQRDALGAGRNWVVRGLAYLPNSYGSDQPRVGLAFTSDSTVIVADTNIVISIDSLSLARYQAIEPRIDADPTESYVTTLLNCPSQILAVARAGRGSVDPRCNLR